MSHIKKDVSVWLLQWDRLEDFDAVAVVAVGVVAVAAVVVVVVNQSVFAEYSYIEKGW